MANGNVKRDVVLAFIFLFVVYSASIAFYHNIEGWNYLDAAYFTTVTITTIGFGDVIPKTDAGKIFTIVLAFVGISIGFFLIASLNSLRQTTIDQPVSNKLISTLRAIALLKQKDKESNVDAKTKQHLKRKLEREGSAL
jgi:voltage-gated potassium channel Kch